MPVQWRSIFAKPGSDYRKSKKLKEIIGRLTKTETTKDTIVVMPQLSDESMTESHKYFTAEEIQSFRELWENATSHLNSDISSTINGSTQISINLESLVNNEIHTIARENFKIKIIKENDQDEADPQLIKVKIIVPKGSSYTYNDDSTKDTSAVETRIFQPEDFSVVPSDFAAFANSLVNASSMEFNQRNSSSPKPMPEVDESSHYITCDIEPQIETNEEKLNNTFDLPSDNETKSFSFINNNEAGKGFLSVSETKKDDLDLSREISTKSLVHVQPEENMGDKQLVFKSDCYDDLRKEYIQYTHVNSIPIMGRRALLAKSNVVKEKLYTSKNDLEIIKQLITEKYNKFFTEYHRRSIKRKSNREKRLICTAGDLVENISGRDENISPIEHSTEQQLMQVGQVNLKSAITKSVSDKEFDSGNSSPKEYEDLEIEYTPATSVCSSLKTIGCLDIPTIEYQPPTCEEQPFFEFTGSYNAELSFEEWTKHNSWASSCRSSNFGELLDSFDHRKFLIDALGHEFNTSDAVSEEEYTYTKCVNRMISEDYSVSTSAMSELISNASVYSGQTENRSRDSHKLSRKNTIIEEQLDMSSSYVVEDKRDDDEVSELVREAAIQLQIIEQTMKALSICKNTKEFEAGPEQLEAERILLTACCQREVILRKIKSVRGEHRNQINHPGSVRLSNFRFTSMSSGVGFSETLKRSKNCTQWFVCIVSCDTKVFATDATIADFDGNVYINSEIAFDNLDTDFEVTVAIYSMSVKHSLKNYSHESKYHLNKGSKIKCPSPSKIFNFRRREPATPPTELLGAKPTSFSLWGTASIRICDLDKSSFEIRNTPRCSTLLNEFSVTIDSWVDINEEFAGFLNIGTTQFSGGPLSWNKRWCSLRNSQLRLWHDPCANGDPLQVIDLRSCVNSSISSIDRSICARPRSLLLETIEYNQVVKTFLQADTMIDLNKWEHVFNSVLSSLRMWRYFHNYVSLDESAL